MALWISFAVLTAIAALAILRPFWRAAAIPAEKPRDIEVYRQQLEEIQDEAARGVLGPAEAHATQIELSRRILLAAEMDSRARPPAAKRGKWAPYVMAVALPAIALSLYTLYGSPQFPGQPLSSRVPHEGETVESLLARVEERLRTHPEDGMGWSVIAPVYMRLGRYADAAAAFSKASKLLGETAERAASQGEALALAKRGTVDPQARQAFEKALSLDPDHTKARFWLAIAEEQAGRTTEALAIHRELLERDLPDAAKSVIRERIALIEGGPASQAGAPANGDVGPAEIARMVSGLAERLKQDGSDLKGWLMLVRAYTVLGRQQDAVSALKEARDKFAGNGEALAQIDALAKSLGLPS
jgi:cytochrome c-type biogenesis protein CcmH